MTSTLTETSGAEPRNHRIRGSEVSPSACLGNCPLGLKSFEQFLGSQTRRGPSGLWLQGLRSQAWLRGLGPFSSQSPRNGRTLLRALDSRGLRDAHWADTQERLSLAIHTLLQSPLCSAAVSSCCCSSQTPSRPTPSAQSFQHDSLTLFQEPLALPG